MPETKLTVCRRRHLLRLMARGWIAQPKAMRSSAKRAEAIPAGFPTNGVSLLYSEKRLGRFFSTKIHIICLLVLLLSRIVGLLSKLLNNRTEPFSLLQTMLKAMEAHRLAHRAGDKFCSRIVGEQPSRQRTPTVCNLAIDRSNPNFNAAHPGRICAVPLNNQKRHPKERQCSQAPR